MPLIQGDIVEVTCKLNFMAVSAVRNVFHLKAIDSEAISDAAITEIIADRMAVLYAILAPIMSNNMAAETVQVVNLTQNRLMGEVPWGTAFSGGTSTANSYALGVSAVLRLITGVRGHQGRKFFGILSESTIGDDALLATSVLTALGSFAVAMLPGIEIANDTLIFQVYDRIAKVGRAIVECVISAVPGYQRRRKQGRGI